jgi:Fe(II)/alpha-ketoglutarate-dependent arginine beta-hydroxylase
MNQLTLSGKEVGLIQSLLGEIASRHNSAESHEFLIDAALYAHELPIRVRKFLNDFKHLETKSGVGVIAGFPVSNHKIGETPSHWKERRDTPPTLEEEMLLVLFGSLLGDPLGWATQQNGYLVHDVLPIKENEQSQLGTGSRQTLWWHNEDAFHPYRGDYIGLMCLRNPDRVPTTYACVDMLELDPKHIETLFEPRFIIRPDESHYEEHRELPTVTDAADDLLDSSYKRIAEMNSAPQKLAALFGDPKSPYVCIDPYFMTFEEGNDEARDALDALFKAMDDSLTELVLQPGSFLFIDNYRAVHGRKPFKAKYDGTDRWLKRINITRDLRKSRASRLHCTSRIIFS